jgi:simple sugar transport system ATP-binding protein
VIATEDTATATRASLAELMVGREVLFEVEKTVSTPGEPVIEAHQLQASNNRGLPALNGTSLTVHSGEVVGIAGVSGNGQSELAEVLTGLKTVTSGNIFLDGQDVTRTSVRSLINLGVAHIPEDRMGQGLALPLTVAENTVLHGYRNPEFNQGIFLNYGLIHDHAQSITQDYDVRTPSVDVPARQLSGGNLQKIILGRELSRNPRFIMANQPTRGLDVGSCEYVRKNLIVARDRGAGVLLISEDLDELMDVSDRILVMYQGLLYQAPEDADLKTLGLMMAGEELPTAEIGSV